MSLNNIKTNLQNKRGFTIVELLIVIVVIGILAAITIVAYNGVTARANTAASETAAGNFAKKAEVYQADGGQNRYPITAAELTSAASTTTYALTGVTPTYSTTELTNSSPNSTIRVLKCSAAVLTPTNNQAAVVAGNITGLRIYSFDYAANAESSPLNIGDTTNCPTS